MGGDGGIDGGNRLQIGIQPRLGDFRRLLRASKVRTAASMAQYFKSPKCLLAELALLTTETLRFLGEALRVPDQLPDEKRGRAGEDREQQD